jgi:hypothetical protein
MMANKFVTCHAKRKRPEKPEKNISHNKAAKKRPGEHEQTVNGEGFPLSFAIPVTATWRVAKKPERRSEAKTSGNAREMNSTPGSGCQNLRFQGRTDATLPPSGTKRRVLFSDLRCLGPPSVQNPCCSVWKRAFHNKGEAALPVPLLFNPPVNGLFLTRIENP